MASLSTISTIVFKADIYKILYISNFLCKYYYSTIMYRLLIKSNLLISFYLDVKVLFPYDWIPKLFSIAKLIANFDNRIRRLVKKFLYSCPGIRTCQSWAICCQNLLIYKVIIKMYLPNGKISKLFGVNSLPATFCDLVQYRHLSTLKFVYLKLSPHKQSVIVFARATQFKVI